MKARHVLDLVFSQEEVVELMLTHFEMLRNNEIANTPEWDQLDIMLNHARQNKCVIDTITDEEGNIKLVLMVNGAYEEEMDPGEVY